MFSVLKNRGVLLIVVLYAASLAVAQDRGLSAERLQTRQALLCRVPQFPSPTLQRGWHRM